MANRRMFSLDVVDTDNFLDMPISAQCLYFHLGMRADDDGFVSSPRRIVKLANCSSDDMKILVSKGYVIPFESGIVVICHWKQNNSIRTDRYKATRFLSEKGRLYNNNGKYEVFTTGIPDGIPSDIPAGNPDKVSIGKYSIDKYSINTICPEPEQPAADLSGILLPLIDGTDYDVPLQRIEKWGGAYPAVDIKQELYKMAAWLESNPVRRKTRRGIDRFINNWLSREQDRGGAYKASGRQQVQRTEEYEYPPEYKEMYKSLGGNNASSPDGPF